jgi:thiaminase/transcriptional activator TenA
LLHGTLSQERFLYYVAQDQLYLRDFARCHALLAARSPSKNIMTFLRFAQETCVAEQELIHQFYLGTSNINDDGRKKTSALVTYSNYLLRTCALDSIEVASAALLPCFMVYQQLGVWMAEHGTAGTHPYARWIEVYSSESFLDSVQCMQNVVDDLASSANASLVQSMLDGFYQSMCWEWHFWNDAYALQRYDAFLQQALELQL